MSFGKKKTFGGSTYTAPVEPVPPTKAPEPMQTVMVNGVPHIPINGQLIPIGGSKVNWLMILLGLVLAAIIIGGSLLLLRSEFGGGGGSEPVIEISAAEDAGRDIQQYIPKLAALYAEAAKKARSGEFRDGVAANEFIKPKKKEIMESVTVKAGGLIQTLSGAGWENEKAGTIFEGISKGLMK